MKIVTLLENTKSELSDLRVVHGLSIYVETNEKKLLFDVGPDDSFARNASILGVNIEEVDCLIISHAHKDHCGGLETFFKLNNRAKVYIHSGVRGEFFSRRFGEMRSIGPDLELLENYKERIVFIDKKTKVYPFMTLIMTSVHNTFVPKDNENIFIKKHGKIVLDDFAHELIMVVEENDVLQVFTACSHSGIINMVLSVEKEFPGRKIETLVGGFHLMNPHKDGMLEEESIVVGLAKTLIEHRVEKVFTGHCTGQEAYGVLKSVLGGRLEKLYTGSRY
ncbi:MAG: MBL fold metallo-hydrolase [Eubacteriales bacterium]